MNSFAAAGHRPVSTSSNYKFSTAFGAEVPLTCFVGQLASPCLLFCKHYIFRYMHGQLWNHGATVMSASATSTY
ncbi:uncharacterized protein METZ01_LOCUS296383, partial [marine metagenome]